MEGSPGAEPELCDLKYSSEAARKLILIFLAKQCSLQCTLMRCASITPAEGTDTEVTCLQSWFLVSMSLCMGTCTREGVCVGGCDLFSLEVFKESSS